MSATARLALTGILLALPVAAQQDLQPAEGELFPDLVFPTIDGGTASLKDFRGQKVLLLQFASW